MGCFTQPQAIKALTIYYEIISLLTYIIIDVNIPVTCYLGPSGRAPPPQSGIGLQACHFDFRQWFGSPLLSPALFFPSLRYPPPSQIRLAKPGRRRNPNTFGPCTVIWTLSAESLTFRFHPFRLSYIWVGNEGLPKPQKE